MQWKTTRPPLLDDYDADNNDGKPYVYLVPAASLPQTKMVFRRTQLTFQETAELVYREGASFTTDWQRLREPPQSTSGQSFGCAPAHIGPLISSGQLKTVNLGDMLVRGSASKEIVAQDEYGQLVDKDSPRCKTWTERFTTKIHCITSTGRYKVLSRPDELRDLLERYGSLLHEIVQDRYPPLYTGPTAQEWKILGTLMPKKTLPGRKEAGLLTAQKHVVAATCRVLPRAPRRHHRRRDGHRQRPHAARRG